MGARMSLGKFIATKRKLLHKTQEQLAEEMHVSKSAIGKWETDRGIPDRNNLYKLAETLEEPIDILHRFILKETREEPAYTVNITPEIITILESYGYKVIGPERNNGGEEDGLL